jgi:hypothetical protein
MILRASVRRHRSRLIRSCFGRSDRRRTPPTDPPIARILGPRSRPKPLVVAEGPSSRAGVASRREGLSLRNVAERSGRRPVGRGFPNRLEDLLDRGLEEEKDPLGHGPSVHLHREFAAVPVHHFHFDSRFFPQCVRQTGGMFSGSGSGRAFSNGYLFHNWPSSNYDTASPSGDDFSVAGFKTAVACGGLD